MTTNWMVLHMPPGWSPQTKPIDISARTANPASEIVQRNNEGSTAQGLTVIPPSSRSARSIRSPLTLTNRLGQTIERYPRPDDIREGYVYGVPQQWMRILQGNIQLEQWPRIMRRGDFSWQAVTTPAFEEVNPLMGSDSSIDSSISDGDSQFFTADSPIYSDVDDPYSAITQQQSSTSSGEQSKIRRRFSQDDSTNAAGASTPANRSYGQLTPEQQQQVSSLRQRDTEVRTHEASHIAAGGGLVRGGASYTYQTGPDGRRYATGGEVAIDVGKASSPQETINKMRQVRSAALAPATPSPQDYAVAAAAAQHEETAQRELTEQQRAQNAGTSNSALTPPNRNEPTVLSKGYERLSRPASHVIRATAAAKAYNWRHAA